jgi:PHD/YefM family antitoxin component YafN of YafNO toxin-antitoxin module
MMNSSTEPEIVMRNGKAVVILAIEEYHELLERAEDVEHLRALEEMRRGPVEFRRLEDFLSEYSPDV